LALKRAGFSLADIQSDVFARNRFLHWPTASSMTFCYMLSHMSTRSCLKSLVTAAGIADRCLYSVLWTSVCYTDVHECTHVPASVDKFCSQLDCLVDTDLER